MEKTPFTFSSLGIWRKIYVVFIWVFSGGGGALLLSAPVREQKEQNLALFIALGLLFLFIAIYTYYAVSGRRVAHQVALLVLNLATANVIGALIVLAIIQVSKKERAMAQQAVQPEVPASGRSSG